MTYRLSRRRAARLAASILLTAISLPVSACVPLPSIFAPTSAPGVPPTPAETGAPTPEEPLGEATPIGTVEPATSETPEPEPTDEPVPPTETQELTPPTSVATSTPSASSTATPVPTGPILANPDGQFSMLLLGYGGPGHDGPYLTDSMMVVTANPAKKTVTLLSLPRDIWVPLCFSGNKPNSYDKLNTAFAYAHDTRLFTSRIPRYAGPNGAGNMAKDTVSQILGIPIDYYLAVDFQSFKDVVDTLDGIYVDVPNSFTARYPANDNPDVNAAWTTIGFVKGWQRMDGTHALQYARAREVLDNRSEIGDFARATRQRLILTAVKNRVIQPAGLLHLPQLFGIATRSSVTDYPLPAVTGMIGMLAGWNEVKIYQASLSNSNYLQSGTGRNGMYILLPRADGLSWSSVRAFARRLWHDPVLGIAMSKTEVLVRNRSGDSDLGSQVSARLEALGYEVDPPEKGSAQAETRFVDQSGGTADLIVGELAKDLGLQSLRVTMDVTASPKRIVLELGKDAVGVVRTDLPPAEPGTPSSNGDVRHVGSWSP